jgi:xanthine/CO dehydrogenase XdhC/CoxF family maturation factor
MPRSFSWRRAYGTDAEEIFPRWSAGAHKQRVAMATVVQTWARHPERKAATVVNERGDFVGSVSRGCIEGAVVTEALAAMKDGKPRTLEFGISDEQAWKSDSPAGDACGCCERLNEVSL